MEAVFSKMWRETARKVRNISASLRYLVDVVGRKEDVAVKLSLTLFCAAVAVNGEKLLGTEWGRPATDLKWKQLYEKERSGRSVKKADDCMRGYNKRSESSS